MDSGGKIEDDWRFQNASGLKDQKFKWKKYTKWSEKWDHDHCSGCWATFSEIAAPDHLYEGYASLEGKRKADYYWVCRDCFDFLKEKLNWSAVE